MQLIKFIEKIKTHEGVFSQIIESGQQNKTRLEDDLNDVLSETFDMLKIKDALSCVAMLKELDSINQVKEYFRCKSAYFQRLLKKNIVPKTSLITILSAIQGFLTKNKELYESLFSDYEDLAVYFYIDVITEILNLLKTSMPPSISEVYEISEKVLEINTKIFYPVQCNMWPEAFEIIVENIKQKIVFFSQKTIINFENLIKLYGWESSGTKEIPILEFGSLSVLYNNTLTIINEIRYFFNQTNSFTRGKNSVFF